jgi:CarD family transcriptional regulator
MSMERLTTGDRVLHPMFGFGVIESLTTREQGGQARDYYNITLSYRAVISVPVARAEALGLRRVVNGLATILACLRAPARALPEGTRERTAELSMRWQASQPTAVARTMRDLLGCSRALTMGDKRWLAKARERLSAEAALVDDIGVDEARRAIQNEMDQFKQHQSG